MVNSIEGLRERVQSFTLEQVSEVDQRLRKMSVQLGELQQTVNALAEIQQKISGLQVAVQQSEAEILERSELVTAVEPVAVQSIARIGTLLKFHRVLKSIKQAKSAPGVSVSLDGKAGAFPAPRPIEAIPASPALETDLPSFEHESTERLNSLVTGPKAPEDSGVVFYTARTQVNPECDLSNSTETTALEASTQGQQVAADLSAIEDPFSNNSSSDAPVDDVSEGLEATETTRRLAVFEPYEPFSDESDDGPLDERTTSIEPQEIVAEFADTRNDPPSPQDLYEADIETFIDQTQMPVSGDTDFDQRLLDDLIKDYGEFTILPGSTKQNTTKENDTEPKPVAPQVDGFVPPIVPTPSTLPMARRDGDLDRKLKKLIKDYGEYDLYSRQTPLKLKTGVVLAFIVLTLIFSGFYFFSWPKLPIPGNSPSVVAPGASSETAPRQTTVNTESRNSETTTTPSASNPDLPKPVETGASQSLSNRGQTKKIIK
jgi:hypothetical protein